MSTDADRGATAGQTLGWALLAWLAGFGAIPFVTGGTLAISEALGLPEQILGTFGLAVTAALVAWVAGRPGPSPGARFAVGAAFVPVIQAVNALALGVRFPLVVLAVQTVVGAIGAGTQVGLSQRRARLRS